MTGRRQVTAVSRASRETPSLLEHSRDKAPSSRRPEERKDPETLVHLAFHRGHRKRPIGRDETKKRWTEHPIPMTVSNRRHPVPSLPQQVFRRKKVQDDFLVRRSAGYSRVRLEPI